MLNNKKHIVKYLSLLTSNKLFIFAIDTKQLIITYVQIPFDYPLKIYMFRQLFMYKGYYMKCCKCRCNFEKKSLKQSLLCSNICPFCKTQWIDTTIYDSYYYVILQTDISKLILKPKEFRECIIQHSYKLLDLPRETYDIRYNESLIEERNRLSIINGNMNYYGMFNMVEYALKNIPKPIKIKYKFVETENVCIMLNK